MYPPTTLDPIGGGGSAAQADLPAPLPFDRVFSGQFSTTHVFYILSQKHTPASDPASAAHANRTNGAKHNQCALRHFWSVLHGSVLGTGGFYLYIFKTLDLLPFSQQPKTRAHRRTAAALCSLRPHPKLCQNGHQSINIEMGP